MRENALLAKKLLPELHKEPEVHNAVVRHEREAKAKLPNEPTEKVEAYLNRLHDVFLAPDERVRERNITLLKPKLHEEFVISRDEFPEAYFELQKRILRERGQAVEEILPADREVMKSVIIEDQTKKLDEWVEYLSSDDAVYPDWFRYFAFRNVVKLSQFDKARGEFKKRSKSTTASFPDIDREALAQLCDKYVAFSHGETGKFDTDEAFKEFAGKKFADLYAVEVQRSLEAVIERGDNTKGSWVTYAQGDMVQAEALYESLQGKSTGWCTAGKSTAESQINAGDFSVYYTYKDTQEEEAGTPSQPRLAIRMNGSEIAEVRGVLQEQEVEPIFAEVLEDKLGEFGDKADAFKKKTADMKHLTSIDKRTVENAELDGSDLVFLYEITARIEGFGYQRDPRISEILAKRNPDDDLQQILNDKTEEEQLQFIAKQPELFLAHRKSLAGVDKQLIVDTLLAERRGVAIAEYAEAFEELNQSKLALRLAREGFAGPVVKNLERFKDLDEDQLSDLLIEQGSGNTLASNIGAFKHIDKVDVGRRLLKEGVVVAVAENIHEFEGLSAGEILAVVPQEHKIDFLVRNSRTLLPRLSEIPGLDHKHLVDELLERGRLEDLVGNLKQFKNVDTTEVARSIIEKSHDGLQLVSRYIHNFSAVPIDVALNLIEGNSTRVFLTQPDSFSHLDQNVIVQKILEQKSAGYVISECGIEKLRGLTYDTAVKLVEKGFEKQVAQGVEAFSPEQERSIYELLLRMNKENPERAVRLSNFHSLSETERTLLLQDKGEISNLAWGLRFSNNGPANLSKNSAQALIENREDYTVGNHIGHFLETDHDAIARMLLKRRSASIIIDNFSRFKNLSVATLRKMISYYPDSKGTRNAIRRRMREIEPNVVKRFIARF